MKVALIGLGRWGTILKGELSKTTEIKYTCDSKTDLNQIFSDLDVQAVFIATPTETHFEIARKALEAGKHVFLEKPGTTNSTDLEKLVNLAKERNLKFAVDYEFTYHPGIKKVKELIEGKNIKSIHLEWQKWGTFKDDAVMHLLCHDVSVLKYLGFNSLSPFNTMKKRVISDSDLVWTEFKSEKETYIESLINRASPIKQKTLTVLLDKGGYIMSNNDLFSINTETQALDKIELPDITPVSASIEDFLSAITDNREPQSNSDFALEVFKVIEKVKY